MPASACAEARTATTTRTYTDRGGTRRNTVGWEYVHIAIDDATRLAYVEVLSDEQAKTAVAFFRRALAFFARHGIEVERVLSDNGACYRSKLHAFCCRLAGIRHLRTRPYRPQTNGKAERFIRTMLGGWAYGAIYRSSAERRAALDGWLWHYNHQRPHRALGRQTPAARLTELNRNNLLRSYRFAGVFRILGATGLLLAMQKVEGSNPFSRSRNALQISVIAFARRSYPSGHDLLISRKIRATTSESPVFVRIRT